MRMENPHLELNNDDNSYYPTSAGDNSYYPMTDDLLKMDKNHEIFTNGIMQMDKRSQPAEGKCVT